MHSKLYLYFISLAVCWLSVFTPRETIAQIPAPALRFQHLGVEDGLSDVFISDILQDESGFVWIATQYGLNRFDGYDFLAFTYDADDTVSLAANWVEAMDLDEDGNLWLGTWGGGLHRFDLLTQDIDRFPQSQSLKGASISNRISVVDHDSEGKIWMGTPEGLAQFDPAQQRFFYFPPEHRDDYTNLYALAVDPNGFLWLGNPQGLVRMSIPRPGTEFLQVPSGLTHFPGITGVKHIHLDEEGSAWVAAKHGLAFIPKGEDSAIRITHDPGKPNSLRSDNPKVVFKDAAGRVWVGFETGLDVYLAEEGTCFHFNADPENPASIKRGGVNRIFEDRQGNIWVATSTGISVLGQHSEQFDFGSYTERLRSHLVAREILKTSTHVWLGGSQLLRYDIGRRQVDTLLRRRVRALLHDPGRGVWAGTQKGLVLLEEESGRIHPFSEEMDRTTHNPKAVCIAMAKDHRGRIWMGTSIGLWVFDPEAIRFQRVLLKESAIQENTVEYVLSLVVGPDHTLWVGTSGQGVFSFDLEESFFDADPPRWKGHFSYDPRKPRSLSNNVVMALEYDQEGKIWAGTDGGLNRLDPETGEVTRYLRKHGLGDDKIMDVIRDHLGDLWVSTLNHGLYKVRPGKGIVDHFGLGDGLRSASFLYSSAFRAADSSLWFGNLGGINVFRSDQVRSEKVDGKIRFTELWVNHQRVRPGEGERIDVDVPFLKELELSPEVYTISLKFAVLNHAQSDKIKYAYLLEGDQGTWQILGGKREVIFSNLDPGTYALQVRATDMFDPAPPSEWTGASANLVIRVIPPWWRTIWAKVGYVLLALLVVVFVFQFRLKRKLTQAENARLRELSQLRNRLYTNISHEFRTPLTIIQGVSQQVLEDPGAYSEEELREKLGMVGRNGEQMLGLVNQMLELSRVEAGMVSPDFKVGDLAAWMRVQMDAFHAVAEAKGLDLHFQCGAGSFEVLFAPEELGRIVGNLLSNAVKFTPKGGEIYLQLDRVSNSVAEEIRIKVRDTGIGIPKEQLSHIFDRFYRVSRGGEQVGRGTGIGLALCKELVALLQGRIEVNSVEGEGTEFELHFPLRVGDAAADTVEVVENAGGPMWQGSGRLNGNAGRVDEDAARHRILVVEDHEDVQAFIASVLGEDYTLFQAKNGVEGLESALEEVPDLILSDVLMPKKDGLEMLRELKSDFRTSHIPVVLLTAKATVEDRLEGLERGADAYLAKPFLPKELKVRISNLIQQRALLQEKYQRWISEAGGEQEVEESLPENAFLKRVLETIEEHHADQELDVARLCRLLGMSRSQLHKKLKALTGNSTTHFVRSVRLEKAKGLLESQPELTVAEVAYSVGFKDPNYFTRSFSSEFGVPPSKWKGQ